MDTNESKGVARREPFHRRFRSIFVSVFVLIPLVLIPIVLIYALGKEEFMGNWYSFYVQYDHIHGLEKGSTVSFKGIKIGHVNSIALNPDGHVDVHLKVSYDYADIIKQDSRAQLKQKNMMVGDWEIEIQPGAPDEQRAHNGDTLISKFSSQLDQTIDKVMQLVSTIDSIAVYVLSGKGTVGKILKEDSVAVLANKVLVDIRRLLSDTRLTVGSANSTLTNVNTFISSGDRLADSLVILSDSLKPVIENINTLLAAVETITDSVPAVIAKFYDDLEEAELLIKGIQNHWLIRRGVKKEKEKQNR
jgi:phospholipid/cholesterol/gamma-HCH transport system substrate-binding protein